ncbi:phage tail tape measure protein [Kitasatospora sp. NPDC018619]|uniref:phage tail tape measure protein n=1 Tax=unclassified Kitasatospora TaxID=2633591 RepID=UPI0037AEECDB
MADRTVTVRVVADTSQFDSRMRGAGTSALALEQSAMRAGRGAALMGAEAGAAQAGLAAMGTGARGGAAAVREAEQATATAARGVRAVGAEVSAAAPLFGQIGTAARGGMQTVQRGTEGALGSVQHLGLLLAGGTILYGLHEIVHAGNEYQDSLLKFMEVTRATGGQMELAGREARALGADMKLPSANAAEAAEAMTELAKAGLSAEDAIKAARGTIQLSAAARTDVATAARIEGDIMDQFALKASQATRVADVLANATNSASGELMDMYYAMKYVGPTANSLSISIEDTATAIGLLGKSGIIGETAGTSLRGALVNLAKPTKQAAIGLKTLGIEAWDSQGHFKGLRYVVDQLHDAQHNLSEQQFTASAAMAFGKPALSAMTALAHQGAEAWDAFAIQVGRAGGAAALAAAESKGLGGAMRGLGKQLQAAFLEIYLGIAPHLESITRGMADAVSRAIPYIKRGIEIAGNLWELYGPRVEHVLAAGGTRILHAAKALAEPVGDVLARIATRAIPIVAHDMDTIAEVYRNARSALRPFVDAVRETGTALLGHAGALEVLAGRVHAGVGLLSGASRELGPLASIVGSVAHAFAELPGPLQLSVLGMIALRPFRPQVQALRDTVVGYGRAGVEAFRGVGDSILYQRVLAAGAGRDISQFGGALAALQYHVPVIGRMATAFRDTSAAVEQGGGRLAGFRGALAGTAMAVGVGAGAGLMGAMRGLWSFLGGPWGIAIAGAMIGLDYLAKKQQEAAAAAEAHRVRITSLTSALQQSHGAVDASVRAAAVQILADAKLKDGKTSLLDTMKAAKVSATELTNAYLGEGASIPQLRQRLLDLAQAHTTLLKGTTTPVWVTDNEGNAYKKAAEALKGLDGEVPAAIQRQKDLAAALQGSGSAAGDATNPTGRLKAAIDTLSKSEADADTKSRALRDALRLLSGGQLDVEAAMATMNRQLLDLNAAWANGVDHAQGFGAALIGVDGSLNTATENGQQLWNKLQALTEGTAAAAQATYDLARSQGVDLATALNRAQAPMQTAWEAAVKAGEEFGLTADQAKFLAYRMGLIPSYLAITMSTPGMSQTQKELLYVQGLTTHLAEGTKITVSALTAEAVKNLTDVGIAVRELPGGRQMEITVPTQAAQANLNALINRINAIPTSKSVNVSVNYSGAAMHQFGDKPNEQANGSVRRYADGGIRAAADGLSGRQAMMSSQPILWAEAGPEAYIPLSTAKRGRSMALLSEVAGIFGQQLIPATPMASQLIPARRLASPMAAAAVGGGGRTTNITLYGAQQGIHEQLADLVRHQQFIT